MPPLETLRAELTRHSLPRPYIKRVCGEWLEHLETSAADLAAEGHAPEEARHLAAERLGCPRALALRLHEQRRAQSICLRHPATMTLVVSVAVFLALAALQLLLATALWITLPPEWLALFQRGAKPALWLACTAVTFPLFEAHFGRRLWFVASLVLLTVLNYTAVVSVRETPEHGAVAVLRLLP